MTNEEKLDEAVRDSSRMLNEIRDVILDSDQRTTLAYTLDQIRTIKRTLGDLEREAEGAIEAASDDKTFDVDSLGRVEIHRNRSYTKWDKDAVATELAKAIVTNMGWDPEAVHGTIEKFRECVSIGGAKVPFEIATGHRRDEFSTITDRGIKVQITAPDGVKRIEGF